MKRKTLPDTKKNDNDRIREIDRKTETEIRKSKREEERTNIRNKAATYQMA